MWAVVSDEASEWDALRKCAGHTHAPPDHSRRRRRRTMRRLRVAAAAMAAVATAAAPDPRNLASGAVMLIDGYLDQPYCAVTAGGGGNGSSTWVCTITRNTAPEGSAGEHVEALMSADRGASWSAPVRLEPDSPLTNAYSNMAVNARGA